MRIAGALTATVMGVIWLIMASIGVVLDASGFRHPGAASTADQSRLSMEMIISDGSISPVWPYASVILSLATFVLGVLICASQNPIYAQSLFVVGIVSVAANIAMTPFNLADAAIPIIILVAGAMCVLGTRQETEIPGL